jgi:CRP-like cAMP-binding protein
MAVLASVALPVEFSAGQLIFREGELANRFYLILNGNVALQSRMPDGGVSLITTLGQGEVLGWSWLFPPYAWHFDAVAIESTATVFFYGTWLRNMAEEHHELGYELMKRMAEVLIRRLQATRRYAQTNQPATNKLKPVRVIPTPRANRASGG